MVARVDVVRALVPRRSHKRGDRGQGLVEFAMVVPVFLMLLLGMLEFGFAFDQNLTLEYATREGARVGAALANDGGATCNSATTTVDAQILAAVQRVLMSPGSRVKDALPVVGMQVQIWKATASGAPTGGTTTNTWHYAGPNSGPSVDGQRIAFIQDSQNWNPCARHNGGISGTDSIGISLTYTYRFQTPLAGILKFFGGSSASQLLMSDKTVMALNPTD